MIIINYEKRLNDDSLSDDDLLIRLNRDMVRHHITDDYYKENASAIMMNSISETVEYDSSYGVTSFVPEKTSPEEVLVHYARDTSYLKVYRANSISGTIEIDLLIAEFELVESLFKAFDISIDDILLTKRDIGSVYKDIKYADLKLVFTKVPDSQSFYSRPYTHTMKTAMFKNVRGEYTINCADAVDELLISDTNINEFISCANIKTYDELCEFIRYLYFTTLSGDSERILEPLFIHMTNVISHTYMDEDMWLNFSTILDDSLLDNVKSTWDRDGYPNGFIGYMEAIDVNNIDNMTIENVVGFLLCVARENESAL